MNQLRGGYTLHTETLPTMPSMARVNGEGSSGIALFATVLGVKNADCHTPPAVLLRGGSIRLATWVRLPSLHKHLALSVSRYSYGDTAIKGLSLR